MAFQLVKMIFIRNTVKSKSAFKTRRKLNLREQGNSLKPRLTKILFRCLPRNRRTRIALDRILKTVWPNGRKIRWKKCSLSMILIRLESPRKIFKKSWKPWWRMNALLVKSPISLMMKLQFYLTNGTSQMRRNVSGSSSRLVSTTGFGGSRIEKCCNRWLMTSLP